MRPRRMTIALVAIGVLAIGGAQLVPHEVDSPRLLGSGNAQAALDLANELLPETPPQMAPARVIKAKGKQFYVAPGQSGRSGPGQVLTFRVEVQKGIRGISAPEFAKEVEDRLMDHRGWANTENRAFQRVSSMDADFAVTLAKPKTVDRLCAPLTTGGFVSCNINGRAVINLLRWDEGAPDFPTLDRYRSYLISHEVGHGLGKNHDFCAGAGQPGTLMMQQTYTWRNTCDPQELAAPKAARFQVMCSIEAHKENKVLTVSGQIMHTPQAQRVSLDHFFRSSKSTLGSLSTTTDGRFSVSIREAESTSVQGGIAMSFAGSRDQEPCTADADIEDVS